ncbi:MAG: glycosyltransferase family 4 protein [Armatimonadetes bacterium]|nr:glycosyltransferase family 4 protein [Armatimonadota bacterium]
MIAGVVRAHAPFAAVAAGAPAAAAMRLLIVTPVFPPDIGGHATAIPLLAVELCRRGHQVTVLTVSDRADGDDSLYPFSVVRLARPGPRLVRWLRTIRMILKLGSRADVLLVYGLALESVVANALLRRPLVMKVVGDLAWERSVLLGRVRDTFEAFQQRRYGARVEALRRLRAWWIRRADRVIVHSQWMAGWVARWGVLPSRLTVIPNGVELPGALVAATLPLSTPVTLVTAARLTRWKGIDDLIAVVAGLRGLGLVVVGDGPDRGRLEQVAQEVGVSDRVFFAGRRSREETLGIMASCDVFALNSTWEGLPHAVLDAMVLGMPLIATAVGGVPEAVTDGVSGLLIPPSDPDALRRALGRLISAPDERARLAAGARRAAERFTIARVADATEALLLAAAASIHHKGRP